MQPYLSMCLRYSAFVCTVRSPIARTTVLFVLPVYTFSLFLVFDSSCFACTIRFQCCCFTLHVSCRCYRHNCKSSNQAFVFSPESLSLSLSSVLLEFLVPQVTTLACYVVFYFSPSILAGAAKRRLHGQRSESQRPVPTPRYSQTIL